MNADQTGLSPREAELLNQLRQFLDQARADYEILSHPGTVPTAEDGVKRGIGGLAEMAPTLILETEKGYIAAIISGETRLSYKKIKKTMGLKNISLARPDAVLRETGSPVGSVSLVNQNLPTIVDTRVKDFRAVFGGCGLPYHTLRINPIDLIRITRADVFDFTEAKE